MDTPKDKVCIDCGEDLPITEYYTNKRKPDGHDSYCKKCRLRRNKASHIKNAATLKEKSRERRKNRQKKYVLGEMNVPTEKKCGGCSEIKKKENFNVDRSRPDGLSFYCRDCNCAYIKILYEKNKKRYNERSKEYHDKNLEKIRNRLRKRYKEDPLFRLVKSMRGRLTSFLKGETKSVHAMELVGCTREEFQQYLELFFYPHPITGEEMTMARYGQGGWDVDHIIPLFWFDRTSEEDLRRGFHACNSQPMWETTNFQKNKKRPDDIIWEDLYDAWVARCKQKKEEK